MPVAKLICNLLIKSIKSWSIDFKYPFSISIEKGSKFQLLFWISALLKNWKYKLGSLIKSSI